MAQITDLKEQVAVLTQQRFGARSEKNLDIPGQLSLQEIDGKIVFNEAEAVASADLTETPIEEGRPCFLGLASYLPFTIF